MSVEISMSPTVFVERHRTRRRMLHVTDQLADEPRLLRVVNTAMNLEHESRRQQRRPRDVMHLNLGVRPDPQSLGRVGAR